MSKEAAQEMSEKYDTKPTIETVLERINVLEQGLNNRIHKMEERIGIRLNRIESEVKATRSEFLTLRADVNEARQQAEEV